MNEQLQVEQHQNAAMAAMHGAMDRFRDLYEQQKANVVKVALVAGMTATAVACAGAGGQENGGTTIPGTEPRTDITAPSAGAFEFTGPVTDGADAAVRLEDDANLYDCGGVKGETYKNADGTEKPFNPDNLISHMNEHPELAASDSKFWTDIFSDEGLSFLATHGIGNAEHKDDQKVTAPEVAPGYADFIAKQNVAALKVDAVAGNFGCKTASGEYKVFPVGPKQLHAGETHLTGIVLDKADYEAFVGVLQKNGKNLDNVFTQEMHVDTDGDGKADKDVVIVFNKHEMCANNELKIPTPPPAPEQPGTPTVTPVPPRPTTPSVTVTTIPGVTVTTPLGEKTPAHPPVTGGAPTTVETPEPGPSTPTTWNAPTPTEQHPTTTGSTIKVTIPTSVPSGECSDC